MKVVTALTPLKSIPTPWYQRRGRGKPLCFWALYYIFPVTSSTRRYMYCGMWRWFRPVCRVPWPSIPPLMKLKFLQHVVMVRLCHLCLMKMTQQISPNSVWKYKWPDTEEFWFWLKIVQFLLIRDTHFEVAFPHCKSEVRMFLNRPICDLPEPPASESFKCNRVNIDWVKKVWGPV